MARKALTKKTRFEVFKRDSFACQYCGQCAPIVVLNVDHIHPIASGGTNDILNLITSCFDCNSGKKDRLLRDDTVLSQQMKQAKVISEKREQIKMIAQWKQSLMDLASDGLAEFDNYIANNHKTRLNEKGLSKFKKCIRKYGLSDVLLATDKSAHQYLDDVESYDDREKFLEMIERICYWQKREREYPELSELRRIANFAKKSWWTCYPNELTSRLIKLHREEFVPVEDLDSIVSSVKGITEFENEMQAYFDELEH